MADPLDQSLSELANVSRIARLAGLLRKLLGRPEPAAVLKRRGELVAEFEREMPGLPAVPRDSGGEPPDVMLIPHARYKQAAKLPVDRRLIAFRPWCWTIVAVAALDQDQGALVVHLGHPLHVKINSRGTAREVWGSDADDAQAVFLLGLLPLEKIRYIDWHEATDYQTPRFYGQYRWRSPIRQVFAWEVEASQDQFKRYPRIEEIKRFKPRRWHRIKAFQFELAQRKRERRYRLAEGLQRDD